MVRFFGRLWGRSSGWLVLAVYLSPLGAFSAHLDQTVVSPQAFAERVALSDAERSWIAQKKIIRIRVSGNPPEQFFEAGQPHGLAVDYAKLICQAHGLNCQFIPFLGGLTLQGALEKVGQSDGPDVLLAGRKTPEREKFLGFSRSYLFSPSVIVARANTPAVFSLEDLAGKRVLVEQGYVIRDALLRDVSDIQILDVENTLAALRKLASGVGDAYVGNLTTVVYLVGRHGLNNLKVVAPTDYPVRGDAIMVRKDWPELVTIFDKSLGAFTPQEKTQLQNFWYSPLNQTLDRKTVAVGALITFLVVTAIIVIYALLAFRAATSRHGEENLKSVNAGRGDGVGDFLGVRQRLSDLRAFILADTGQRQTLENTQALLEQLRPVSAFSNRLSQTIFIYGSMLVGGIGMLGYGYLLFRYFMGAEFQFSLLLPLPFATFLFAVGIASYRLQEVPGWLVWVVVVALLSTFVLGSYLNGALPAMFVVLFVVFFHLIQRLNYAFISSSVLLILVLFSVSLFYPDESVALGVRAFATGVVALALMRFVMITFEKLTVSTGASIKLLDEQAQYLKGSIEKSEITDQRVNVLNLLGFERALSQAQGQNGANGSAGPSLVSELHGRLLVLRVNHLYLEPRQLTPPEEDIYYSSLVARLRQFFGDDSVLARIGQYDFAVLHFGEKVAHEDSLWQQLSAPIEINKRKITPDLRIGVLLLTPDMQAAPSELIRQATLAMREAARASASPVVFYEPSMSQAARYKEHISAAVPNALDRREFRVVYQPIVRLSTRQIEKAEALLRWHFQDYGDVPPSVFVPAIENQGLVGRMTEQVFDQVFMDQARWRSFGLVPPQVSVNISALTLQSPDHLFSMLKPAEEASSQGDITLEITEGALIEDPVGARSTFAELRKRGFSVSLDDFGVGYSSLAYLTNFSLDFLKMDKAFLEGFENDKSRQAVVQAIITVAHSLGMEVVAEGVETQEQLDLLKALGCDYGQGYFFSTPLSADQLVERLGSER